MNITKELLDNELQGLRAKQKDHEASANKLAGAIVVMEDLLKYLAVVELTAEELQVKQEAISPENAEIQARDQANDDLAAIPLQEIVEAVGGKDATYEIEEIDETDVRRI